MLGSVFRIAGPVDLEALYRFEMLCFKDHPFRRDHIAWILGNDRALTLVEDADEALTAVMMLLFEGRTCRVLSVGVVPDARRRGIATRLMQIAEAFSRKRGCATIRLEVSTENLAAISCTAASAIARTACSTATIPGAKTRTAWKSPSRTHSRKRRLNRARSVHMSLLILIDR